MVKSYYILLLLICFSATKGSKISYKNLRNLEANTKEEIISIATAIKKEGNKFTFAITLSEALNLDSNETVNLKILDKNGENTAACKYSESKFNCEYNGDELNFGRIVIPKSTITLDDETTLKINNELTLQQSVDLTYSKAYVNFVKTSSTSYYDLQIYVNEQLQSGAYYQVDIFFNDNKNIANCTYTITTSTSSEKYLSCIYTGNYKNLVRLSQDQENGSIKWINSPKPTFETDVLLKYEVKKIYGYNLYYDTNKWKFYIHVGELNVEKEGYYYKINVLINKAQNSDDISATALCKTIDYHSECTIQNTLGEGESAEDYLIYLSNSQTDASINVKDNSLSTKKIISKIMTLDFVKAYDLKYEDRIWKFKIQITNTGLREGLNVTIDLYKDPYYYTGSCIHSNKILSCVKDNTISQNELLYLSLQKSSGSVTWNNKDNFPEKIKMPLEVQLSHIESYYLKYQDSKWTFKLYVDAGKIIPGNSLINVDILYGTGGKAIAECQGNNATTTSNYKATFICECKIGDNEILKLSNTKESGSVTWTTLTDSSVAKKIEFKFIKAYNLVYTESGNNKIWSFDVQFEDPEKINPTTTSKYSLDINYKDMSKSGASFYLWQAECSLKATNSKIFSCTAKFSNTNTKKYFLYIISPAKMEDSKTINWIEGITDRYLICLKADLTFKKGIINYDNTENTWLINLDVTGFNNDLITNSKVMLDISKNEEEETIECTLISTTSLKCDTGISSGTVDTLPSYTLKRSGLSGVNWKNTETNDDFYYLYLVAGLTYDSADHMSFTNNKWKFNLRTSTLPAKNKIIIDILYNNEASTATCIKELFTTSCTVDKENQRNDAVIKIKKEKSSESTISWNSLSEDQEIEKLSESDIKTLKFKKASGLSLNGNNWLFTVELEETTLTEGDNPIEMDIKINDSKSKAQCTISTSSKTLSCLKPKEYTYDRIKLINNNENPDLVWSNLNEDIELFVIYDIKFVNNYGGFHENKWKFNMKYEKVSNFDVNDNYATLDIKVGSQSSTAKCKITEKFLLCESQHTTQSKDDVIEIQGTKALGTITISNTISNDKKKLNPLIITLENSKIDGFDPSNNTIKFNIKGNLKGGESEIAENTITGVKILLTKKDGNNELDAVCLTNEITEGNNDIELSCEASGSVNQNEDKVDIKVGSDGKSNYVTFYSVKENIKVFAFQINVVNTDNPTDADTTKQTEGVKKNYDFMLKANCFLLSWLFLLF